MHSAKTKSILWPETFPHQIEQFNQKKRKDSK